MNLLFGLSAKQICSFLKSSPDRRRGGREEGGEGGGRRGAGKREEGGGGAGRREEGEGEGGGGLGGGGWRAHPTFSDGGDLLALLILKPKYWFLCLVFFSPIFRPKHANFTAHFQI